MIAVCENCIAHVVVFNNKVAQTHKHVARSHLAIWAAYRGAETLHTRTKQIPTTEAANLSAPPHLPHTHACISARTTADQHAAKPGVE